MNDRNGSSVKEFILLGFPGSLKLKSFLFTFFFFMYTLTISGNVAIISLVKSTQRLHTPMYFFLCNLSFLEIWYTTALVPKTLANLVSQNKTITFIGCITHKCILFFPWDVQNIFFLQSWLMTAIWPYVNHCIINS